MAVHHVVTHLLKVVLMTAALLNNAAHSQSTGPDIKEVNLQADSFIRTPQYPSWSIPLLDIPKIAAIGALQTLYSETQFLATTKPDYLVVRAFQVNDQSALKEVGQYPIDFVPAYEKLRLHSVKVIRGGQSFDKTSAVSIRFLQREVGLENGIYSGTVTAALLTEDIRVGDIFFIAYSKEGANPVMGTNYSNSAAWDSNLPTGLRRVVLLQKPDKPIAWQLHGDTAGKKLNPRKIEHGGNVGLVFEESGLEAMTFENNIPSDFVQGRYLQFSEFKSWQEVAQWGTGLFPAAINDPLPDELNQALQAWAKLPTEQAKAAAALRWVQDEIRYFSVSIGESSHRPYKPADVVMRRYGDCKDKTYLLITLLQKMGIEAYPVLVTQGGFKAPSRSMPTPYTFDHVVTQAIISGTKYYFDGTRIGQRGPIDKMGWGMPGATGLVLNQAARELTLIEPIPGTQRGSQLAETISIPKFGGDATLSVVQTFVGLGAEA
jgi:transglutaminase-like putative cysteine protease